MSKPVKAFRIQSFQDIKADEICYYKENGYWYIYIPNCGVGNLKSHNVTENDNDTITVTPSILLKGMDHNKPVERHGWLTNGVWHEG